MTGTTDRSGIVVGIDPVKNVHMALAWAADEAHLRGLGLRLVVAVPPPRHDPRHVDDSPRHRAQRQAGTEALRTALAWAQARQPGVKATSSLLLPAQQRHAVPCRAPPALGDHRGLVGEVSRRPADPRGADRLPRGDARGRCRARPCRRRRPSRPGRIHRDARRLRRPRAAAPCPLPGDHRPCRVSGPGYCGPPFARRTRQDRVAHPDYGESARCGCGPCARRSRRSGWVVRARSPRRTGFRG